MEFEDLKNLGATDNMGGLKQKIYFARYKDIAKWPLKPKADAEGMVFAKMGELSGDIGMAVEKKMYFFQMTPDEGKLDIEGVGELCGKSFLMKLRIYKHMLGGDLLAFVNMAKNEDMVFIAPDSNGNLFILGDEDRPAVLDSIDGMTTGQKAEERPGAGMVFKFNTANVYKYTGTIPTEPPVAPVQAEAQQKSVPAGKNIPKPPGA